MLFILKNLRTSLSLLKVTSFLPRRTISPLSLYSENILSEDDFEDFND